MNRFSDFITALLGLGVDTKQLTFFQISLRGVIVFTATLMMVRMSSKRSLAEKTSFDAVLIVILASVLARAINGSAPFFQTLGAGFVFVLIHRMFSVAAYYSHALGCLIKGEPVVLARDGKLDQESMRQNLVSIHDFEEDMRLTAATEDLSRIEIARLERSGDISFIKDGS
jgi:uncharacterized membrane protein YcaP (DUF421 family)